MESQNLWTLMPTIDSKVRIVAALVASIGVIAAIECRGAEESRGARGSRTPAAIAQFLGGYMKVIYPNGRIEEFENRTFPFTSSRFSADGQAIVGTLGLDLVVLSRGFETLWRTRAPSPNIWIEALSPSKTQVAFISPAGGDQVSLGLVTSSGEKRTLAIFRRDNADDSFGLSWSPEGDRLVYASEGRVTIVNVVTEALDALGDGFEPTWSPNGKWIAYRRSDGRAELCDVVTRQRSPLARGQRITSKVHWAPDSEHLMVVQRWSGKPTKGAWCPVRTRFVVYGLADGSRREIFNPCLLRDWYYDWVSDPKRWTSGMKPVR